MLPALLTFLGVLVEESPAILDALENFCSCKRNELTLRAQMDQSDAANLAALKASAK
jgi:hypothetical protein